MNSLTGLCITKLDVLDGLDSVAICVDYQEDSDGQVTPVYETLAGWQEASVGVKQYQDLPQNAQVYLDRIEDRPRSSRNDPKAANLIGASMNPHEKPASPMTKDALILLPPRSLFLMMV
jgi:hypothetical protein